MRRLCRTLAVVWPLSLIVCAGCPRERQPVVDDSATPDGGLVWNAGVPASVTPAQSTGWVAASTDPECAALAPSRVPPRLSWTCGTDSTCGRTAVDGQGDLAAFWYPRSTAISYFRPDGSGSAVVTNGDEERQLWLVPGSSGFLLISHVLHP